jgi:hypothetical protein
MVSETVELRHPKCRLVGVVSRRVRAWWVARWTRLLGLAVA